MGCFDSVRVKCPHCDQTNELQSKAGGCFLGVYTLHECPAPILLDIEGAHACAHENCGRPFHVHVAVMTQATVSRGYDE